MPGLMTALLLAAAGAQPGAAAAKVELLARKHLAARLKVHLEQVTTASVRPTTWPDTSLGCAKPGLMYAQVMTPGYLIELKAKGRTFTYHSDRNRVVACDAVHPKSGRKVRVEPVEPPQDGPVEK